MMRLGSCINERPGSGAKKIFQIENSLNLSGITKTINETNRNQRQESRLVRSTWNQGTHARIATTTTNVKGRRVSYATSVLQSGRERAPPA